MLPSRPLKTVNFNLPSSHLPPISLTHTQLSNKGFRLQWTVLASWWWSVCTLRVSLIGIHTMLVDSLYINRWLCGDNVQHIVLAMMHWHMHAHRHIQRLFFKILKQLQGHLLISLFQKNSSKAFQVYEQGFLNRCHLVSTHCGAATAQQTKAVLFCCHCCRNVHNKRLHPLPPVFSQMYFQFIIMTKFWQFRWLLSSQE